VIRHVIATLSVAVALCLDTASYWRQIKKTLKTKKSTQVSSTSFIYKILKAKFSMVGLALYGNWVGVGMEIFMLAVYSIALAVVIKFKPKNWSIWR
jgi:hypothetical protein